MRPYLDCHTHIFPPFRSRKLLEWTTSFLEHPPVPLDATADDIVADLKAHGARRWINLLFPIRRGEARELHRFNAELAARHPEITPFGGVRADDDDPLGVVVEAFETHGMHGMKFHPMVQRFSPADPALAPVFAYLNEREAPVTLHTGYDEWYGQHLPPEDVEHVIARYPRVPFVLAHIGFPRVSWGMDVAERHENVWLDLTNVLPSVAWGRRDGQDGIEEIAEALATRIPALAARTMFGTDHPAGMGTLDEVFAFLAAFGFDDATLDAILCDTPRRFLDRFGRPMPEEA